MDQNFGRQQLGISCCQSPPLEVRLRLVGLEAADGGESGLVLLESLSSIATVTSSNWFPSSETDDVTVY